MSVEPAAGSLPVGRRHRIDDVLWETLWERQLDALERHHIARSVWRRLPPDDPFASLVGFELAFRWRSRATQLTVLWGLWTLFWSLMVSAGARTPQGAADDLPVAIGLVVVGVVVMAACQIARARLRAVVDGSAGFRPAQPAGTSSPPPPERT